MRRACIYTELCKEYYSIREFQIGQIVVDGCMILQNKSVFERWSWQESKGKLLITGV